VPETQNELLPQLAAELVQLPVEVILTVGALATEPAHQATTTIPIVMVLGPDPTVLTASGMVQSLARPGGNVTGTSGGVAPWNTKAVELLKTLLPQLSRLAILGDRSTPNDADMRPPAAHAAQALGLQILDLDLSAPNVDGPLEVAQAWGADALYVIPTATFDSRYPRITELAASFRPPAIYGGPFVVSDNGGLMSFSANYIAAWRQAAEYVDKLLRGAAPPDLPVQAPRQFDFVVNVKTAQDLGITFPPDVAAQVTQWIQ
jgi:putative ABC transport system substrate-binding protein